MFTEIVLDAARQEITRIETRAAALQIERDKENSTQIAWQLRTELEILDNRKGEIEQIQRITLSLD